MAVIYASLFLLWAVLLTPASRGMVESFPLWERICMGIGATAGPIAFMFVVLDAVFFGWEYDALIGILIWATWLALASFSPLRRLHCAVHVALGLVWGSFGVLAEFAGAALA